MPVRNPPPSVNAISTRGQAKSRSLPCRRTVTQITHPVQSLTILQVDRSAAGSALFDLSINLGTIPACLFSYREHVAASPGRNDGTMTRHLINALSIYHFCHVEAAL